MSRVDIYNEEYVELNHAYVEMYKFYNKLLETNDPDENVLSVIREILLVFNPTLDKIKSEMTIKTRYKEETEVESEKVAAVNENLNASGFCKKANPVIYYGNFTGN